MSSAPLRVDVFAEDTAHRETIGPLAARIAREAGVACHIEVRSAEGGHPRALAELRRYFGALDRGRLPAPDVIVVGIDANCRTYPVRRAEILDAVTGPFEPLVVPACPDPHIEKWLMADPAGFDSVVGARPAVPRGKCLRDEYKQALRRAVVAAGHLPTLDGIEFAREIVASMDIAAAARADRSLDRFVSDFRAQLHQRGQRG